ncbi:unnamed protein product [Schistosoma curassoni]|uniref:Transmembrane protein n=1 Tax=Schistosoma curassoni TaxID=6186 RepID=A0A183JDU4_9TREM|nr:unnamed protein product [Schistosoma curassoni]
MSASDYRRNVFIGLPLFRFPSGFKNCLDVRIGDSDHQYWLTVVLSSIFSSVVGMLSLICQSLHLRLHPYPPCSSIMLPRYVKVSTGPGVSPSSVIGLVCVLHVAFVDVNFPLCMLLSTDVEAAATTLSVSNCNCWCAWNGRVR